MPQSTAQRAGRPPVMADVARRAGVSHQTVSRVINGATNIRPETRLRVVEAIAELGYRPNTAARALVTRRSGTIGVISTEAGHWGPASVQRSVEQAAREAGWFVSSVNLTPAARRTLPDAVEHLLTQSVEGMIMIAADDEALELVRAQSPGVPYVVVEGDLSRAPSAVGVDQDAGARLATRHLLELGHERFLHVAGPPSWTEAQARRLGWEDELRRSGLPVEEPLPGDWTAASGFAAGQVVATRQDVTAVFAANDQMALGLLRALAEAGVRVPEDVSVVGFDDIPEAAFLLPPLTTVHQDFAAVGRRAIEVLHAAVTGEREDLPRLVTPTLVVRSSAAPLPSVTRRDGHRTASGA